MAPRFASAPLSELYRKRAFTQFSRVGLSYQFSQSSVKDPAVNSAGTASNSFIPVIYSQQRSHEPRYRDLTYDTPHGSIDPTSGRELSVGMAVAGLAGDVRLTLRLFLIHSSSPCGARNLSIRKCSASG